MLAGFVITAVLGILLWFPPLHHADIASAAGQVQAVDAVQAAMDDGGSWWRTAARAITVEWRIFLYLAVMMTSMNAVG